MVAFPFKETNDYLLVVFYTTFYTLREQWSRCSKSYAVSVIPLYCIDFIHELDY